MTSEEREREEIGRQFDKQQVRVKSSWDSAQPRQYHSKNCKCESCHDYRTVCKKWNLGPHIVSRMRYRLWLRGINASIEMACQAHRRRLEEAPIIPGQDGRLVAVPGAILEITTTIPGEGGPRVIAEMGGDLAEDMAAVRRMCRKKRRAGKWESLGEFRTTRRSNAQGRFTLYYLPKEGLMRLHFAGGKHICDSTPFRSAKLIYRIRCLKAKKRWRRD